MFDYKISKHPHFDEACRVFALRHNMAKLAERAGMKVQTLRNKLNPEQPHQLTPSEIWLLTDLTEDSTLVDGFLAQIHCLPCVPMNEVAKEKLPHYVMSATAEIGRIAAGAVSGDVKTTAGRRDVISSINSVTLKEIAAAINNDPNFSTTINNALTLKAPLANPALTGTPTAPTAVQSTNNTQIATTAFVKSAVAGLVGSSPEALDTLNELAAALGNDPNFATTVMNALAGKQPLDATLTSLSGKSVSALLQYLGLTEALGNKQNYSQQLTALSGLEMEKDKLPFFNSNNSADITTLTKTGRDIIGKNTVDEVRTLLQLGSAALKTIGTGANQVPDMNAFGVSKNETGYQYLPGGLILQWGKVGPTQAGQNTNVTFTITFPTVAASVICSLDATSLPGKGFGCSSTGVSRTGFGFYVANDSDFNSNSGGFWFAIGY